MSKDGPDVAGGLVRTFGDAESLLHELETNLRHGALFVPTDTAPPVGEHVSVTLEPPGASSVEVQGEVLCAVPGGVALRIDDLAEVLSLLQTAVAPAPEPAPLGDVLAQAAGGQVADMPETASDESTPVAPPDVGPTPEYTPTPTPTLPDEEPEFHRRIPYRYNSIEDLRREYDLDLSYGRLFVTTEQRPPVGAIVEIVLLVPELDPYPVDAEVIFHATGGIGASIVDFDEHIQHGIEAYAYGAEGPAQAEGASVPPEHVRAKSSTGDFDDVAPALKEPDADGEDATAPALKVSDVDGEDALAPALKVGAAPLPEAGPAEASPVPSGANGKAEPPHEVDASSAEPATPEEAGEAAEAPAVDSPEVVETDRDGTRILRRNFQRIEEMRIEYEKNIRSGGVFVATTQSPPLRSRVRVIFELVPDGRAVTVDGEVVFESAGGVGVQLEPLSMARRIAFEKLLDIVDEGSPWAQGTVEIPESLRDTGGTLGDDLDAASAPMAPLDTTTEPVVLSHRFEDLDALRHAYADEIAQGVVHVASDVPPPVDASVQVDLALPSGGNVVLWGHVRRVAGALVEVQLPDLAEATRKGLEVALMGVSIGHIVDDGNGEAQIEAAAAEPAADEAPVPPRRTGPPPTVPTGTPFRGALVSLEEETADIVGAIPAERGSWFSVLGALHEMQATGLVTVRRDDETKLFAFRRGRPVDGYAEPPRDDETLTAVIRRRKMLRGSSLHEAEDAVEGVDRAQEIEKLVATGILPVKEIERARQYQVLECCADVMAWETGEFEFDPKGDVSFTRGSTGIPIEQIVLQGVQLGARLPRKWLEEALRASMDRAPLPRDGGTFSVQRLGLTEQDRKVWNLFSGSVSLRRLLEMSPVGASATLRLVFGAVRLGLLRFQDAAQDVEKPAEELTRRLERVRSGNAFEKLGLGWQTCARQIDDALATAKADYGPQGSFRNGAADDAEVAELCEAILGEMTSAHELLRDARGRQMQRREIVQDLDRIKAAARMFADQGKMQLFKSEFSAAELSYEIAHDLDPDDAEIREGLERARNAKSMGRAPV